MPEKEPSKGRSIKKGVATLPSNAFDDYLDDLGLYEDGKPAPYMLPIFRADRETKIGWWHEISGIGREGIGCGEGPFWSELEIILPKQGLFLAAFSFETYNIDNPSDDFYVHDVVWRQTTSTIRRKPLFEGKSKAWRKYKCNRVEKAVLKGYTEEPRLMFTFADEERANLSFEDESVLSFLLHVCRPGRTSPDDRKPYPKILEAIHELDPDNLVEQIRTLIAEHPDFEDPIRLMVPKAFHAAEVDPRGLSTPEDIAHDCKCSKRTILRWAKKLKCKRRVGRHGRFSFNQKDAQKIFDAINAE